MTTGRTVLTALCALVLAGTAAAQGFPNRPIKVVIPIAAGSSGDILLRQVTPRMSEILGQTVYVENRTGGNGLIGTQAVAGAPADGYTLLFAYSQIMAVNPSLYRKLPYDPLKDFTGVGRVAAQALVFVASKAATPAKTVQGFQAWAKANPGKLNYASSGSGTSAHLAGAYYGQVAQVPAQHVPYNSVPQALADLGRGEISYMLYPYPGLVPVIQSGRVQMLAVTGPKRSAFAPELPTMVELGYSDFVIGPWYAFFAPAGTPKEAVDKVNHALNAALADPQVQKLLADSATDAWPSSPDELNRFTASEIERYRRLVQVSGAKVE